MTDTESTLLQALQDILAAPFSAADLDRSLLALGADSLRAAALAVRIHRFWGTRVSVGQLLRLQRVKELLHVLPVAPRPLPLPVPGSARAELDREHTQSPAQALVYMEHFRNPGTTAYNIPVIAELPQPVSVQKFSDALQQVAAGLPQIFARFYEREGRCLWGWRGARDIPLRRFANLDEARREIVQPFNLAEDVLLRAGIVPFDGRHTHLMLDFSHIVADGVSVGHFVGDLKRALSGAPPAPDAMPRIWQADAAWQAQHQDDQAFWQDLLQEAGAKPVWPGLPELPPRTEPGHGYAVQYTDIDEAQAEAFRACAQRSGSTPFTLALLLQYLLQTQWTRVWRSHLGVVVSGRADADYFEAFGMFANTVIVPLDLGAHMPLQEAIARVHGRVLQVLEHQGFPAADQVRLSGARSDDGSHPLLDVLFAFQNIDYQRIDVLGGRFRSFCEAKKMAQFGLVLHVFDIGRQGYQLQWEYCPHRYSHGDVAAFSTMFMRLFQRLLVAGPAAALGVLMAGAGDSGVAAASVAAALAVEFDFGE